MRAIGIILAGGNNNKLGLLTESRAAAALPIGGCYRALDFTLSNMSNSGINKVAVITQYNSRSLHDHLSSAKWWNLGRKNGGLFVFSPYLSNSNSFWFRGTADAIYQNITYLTRSNEPYVIIAPGNAIYKIDFEEPLDFHIEKNSDITIVAQDKFDEDLHDYGVMEIDSEQRLINFEEKPIEPQSNLVSLGVYIISRTLLINLLQSVLPQGRYNLVEDIIIRYRRKLKIMTYKFDGYLKTLNCIKTYYDTNMDFLKKDIRFLFTKEYPFIETKPKDEPPTKYNVGAKIKNSIIGSGSILNSYVENSILFNNVYTGENSCIKNSIIMDKCYIGNYCFIENAILDKEVILSDGKHIIGSKDKPVLLKKGCVV